jgi:hypothetical protein
MDLPKHPHTSHSRGSGSGRNLRQEIGAPTSSDKPVTGVKLLIQAMPGAWPIGNS